MNRLLLLGLGAVVSITLVLPALATPPPVPGEPIKMALTPKPVTFDHAAHAARECGECHHQVNGAENYQKCSDAGCHDLMGQKENKATNSYYRISHERKVTQFNSCLKCHFEVAGSDRDIRRNLTSCVGSACHPKP